MILSDNQLKQLSKEEINSYKYLVMDVEHLNYHEDKQIMKHAIELLNYVNSLNYINNFYEKSNSDIRIQTNIFYKAIESVLLQKAFNDAELRQLYQETNKVEYFHETMVKLMDIEIQISFETNFILLGLNYDNYINLSDNHKEQLYENYTDIFTDFTVNKISIDEFLTMAKELVEKYIGLSIKKSA